MGKGRDKQFGNLDVEMISNFRRGSFDDQPEEVQEAFLFCMLNLMPRINDEWKRSEVHINWLLSSKITPSDEALMYWFLTYSEEHWIEEFEKEQEWQNTNPDIPFPKRAAAKMGQHDSNKYLNKYEEMKQEIKSKWSNEITGKGWDEQVKAEAKRLQDETLQKGGMNIEQKGKLAGRSYPGVNRATYNVGCFANV